MIKVYCDYCKKEIESSNEQVNLNFNAFGCVGFPKDKEYHLHKECAIRVQNKLNKFLNERAEELPPTQKEREVSENG